MKTFHRTLTLFLACLLCLAPIAQAQAAMVTNQELVDHVQHTSDQAILLQTIKRADVQAQMLAMGVSPADVENRIQQMSPQEIAQLNQQIEQAPAGSGVLGLVVLVFIVFVVTDVIGATDIFPFIHPVR